MFECFKILVNFLIECFIKGIGRKVVIRMVRSDVDNVFIDFLLFLDKYLCMLIFGVY